MTPMQMIRIELDEISSHCYEAGRQFADTALLSLRPPWTDEECKEFARVLADQVEQAFADGDYLPQIIEHFKATISAGLFLRYWEVE